MHKIKIAILLSCYNGERFLDEQITSIIKQKTTETFKIYFRDDGSQDKTLKLIQQWSTNYPDIIQLLDLGLCNIGTASSFDYLLSNVHADYYFWCDQDDIWNSKKIHHTIERIKNLETIYSQKLPILVSHDMRIINKNAVRINRSFFSLTKLKSREVKSGLFQGFLPGCSMGFNHAARNEYIKIPRTKTLHDFHLQLITHLTGITDILNKPLTDYRIHSKNQIGLGKNKKPILSIKDFLKYFFNRNQYRAIVLEEYSNIQSNLKEYISEEQLNFKGFYSLSKINNLNVVSRKKWYLKHFKPFSKGMVDGLVRLLLI